MSTSPKDDKATTPQRTQNSDVSSATTINSLVLKLLRNDLLQVKLLLLLCIVLVATLIFQNYQQHQYLEALPEELERLQRLNPTDYVHDNQRPWAADLLLEREDRFEDLEKTTSSSEYIPVDEYEFTVNRSTFSRHVQFNVPFILKGGAKHWRAVTEWQNEKYLRDLIGDEVIQVEQKSDKVPEFAYFQKNFKRAEMKYSEFLDKYKSRDGDKLYYWAEQPIPEKLWSDIVEPEFANHLVLEIINIWQGSIGTISLPHTDYQDNILCQISGVKEMVILPATQRARLYVNERERGNYSPVDFYNPDLEKYPDFKDAIKAKVRVEAGDCLFLPAYWWHHVKSSSGMNIAVNFWYYPNYLLTSFMGAVEGGDL